MTNTILSKTLDAYDLLESLFPSLCIHRTSNVRETVLKCKHSLTNPVWYRVCKFVSLSIAIMFAVRSKVMLTLDFGFLIWDRIKYI